MAAAVTKINVLPLFSRAEQLPFKIPVHVPALVLWSGCWDTENHLEATNQARSEGMRALTLRSLYILATWTVTEYYRKTVDCI